jgi:hypothetical protein
MLSLSRRGFLLLAAVALLALGAGQAKAQYVAGAICYPPAPAVSYYAPAPAVSYYAAPAVSYYAPPAVSYYAAPAVSYYAAPAVSYYAPAASVTTYRYGGLFHPRRVRVSSYYYPGYYP